MSGEADVVVGSREAAAADSTRQSGETIVPRVRAAEPADHPAIAELTMAAYAAGGHMRREDPYMRQLADVAHRAEHGEVVVVELDGEVAASAVITGPGGVLSELARDGEMEFRMLAVDPRHQGRGVARTLVRHLIARAEQAPDTEAVVLCSLRSMTAAHALYRSEGFVEDPTRDLVLEGIGSFPFFRRPA